MCQSKTTPKNFVLSILSLILTCECFYEIRSPSPLAFPVGHQPGSSNTTQSYSPSVGSTPTTTASGQTKKGFVRPKTAEPGSPLLRRALSPDRLHPRSAESKCSLISPLCSSSTPPVVKAQVRGSTSAVWRPTQQPEREKEMENEGAQQTCDNNGNISSSENRLSLNLSGPGELLPRIAEEKDSPTNSAHEPKTSQDKNRDISKCDKNAEDAKKCDGGKECKMASKNANAKSHAK